MLFTTFSFSVMMQIKGKVVPEYSIKACRAEVEFCSFLTWALDAGSGQLYTLATSILGKAPPVPTE